MPETNKIKKEEVKVDLDTSGPEVDVDLPEEKEEKVVETGTTEQEQETVKEVVEEKVKEETKKEDDEKLEDYSKGVQSRIAKLTRKMREAERREQAAIEYARSVEEKRKQMETSFQKSDLANLERFEKNIDAGLQAAERELAAAIESADAKGQIAANKRIAELSFENARIKQAKQQREQVKTEEPVKPADSGNTQQNQLENTPMPDPKAEAWATKNTWFGSNRAMTNTAIAHHQDLENEGYDTTSDEYYQEIDRRMKVDFPAKFGNNQAEKTSAPVQTVASASRSVKPGRKTVRLTSSQVAIAKKLGVPLEEYAKQLKNTEGA